MLAACPFPARQGTQVYLHQLARQLVQRGHQVELVTYGLGQGDVAGFDALAPYRVHRAAAVPGHQKIAAGPSWGRPVADALLTLRAVQVVTRLRRQGQPPLLIHAHNYEGALAGALVSRACGLPLFYHAHNLMGDELESYTDPARRRERALWRALGQGLDRWVPGLGHGGASVSQEALLRLEALGSAPPGMVHLPPAVELGQAAPIEAPPGGWPPLVYMGNADGYQNLDLMLEALARLPESPDAGISCAIVTEDAPSRWEPLLRRHPGARRRVRVVPHGPFAQALAWLEGAQVALLPRTVASGFPVKLINYLAASRPVVACRGGAQGLEARHGVAVVPDGDVEGFAQAVARLLQEEDWRMEMARRAALAAASYAPAQVLPVLEEAYLATLDRWRQRTGGER